MIIDISTDPGSVATVGSPSTAYARMAERWALINDLTGGTEMMRFRSRKWLRPNTAETFQSYERRLYGTILYEGFNLAVESLLGKPFAEEVKASDAINSGPLAPYLTNMDKKGSDITTFCREVAEIGLRKGLVHILVDYNNTTGLGEISIKQKQELGLRPYTVALDPERILGWRYDMDSNVPTLTMVRIEEDYEEPVGPWGSKKRRRVKVFERVVVDGSPIVAWTLYEEPDKNAPNANVGTQGAQWNVVGQGNLTTTQIPLVTIYFGKRTGFMEARPPLMSVAWLNLEHWQSSSEQRNILNVARCPIWFFAGYQPDVDDDGADTNRVVIGPDAMIRCSDTSAKLEIIEHSGNCIAAGRQDLLDIEARMAHLSTELLTKKATSSTSATEKAHDNDGEDSKLGAMIKAEEDGMGTVFDLMYQYEGQDVPVGKLLEINTKFGLEPQDAADLQTLYNSRMEGLISQATYLQELQRRGVLSVNVDLKAEATAAEKDGPVPVKPTAPPPPPTPEQLHAKAGAGA